MPSLLVSYIFFLRKTNHSFDLYKIAVLLCCKKYESNNVLILANMWMEPSLLNVIKANS